MENKLSVLKGLCSYVGSKCKMIFLLKTVEKLFLDAVRGLKFEWKIFHQHLNVIKLEVKWFSILSKALIKIALQKTVTTSGEVWIIAQLWNLIINSINLWQTTKKWWSSKSDWESSSFKNFLLPSFTTNKFPFCIFFNTQ